jgi:glutathione reductase (NADPH)
MKSYDAVVVGAGTGGQTAAHGLKEAGLKVAVAEQSDLPGGVCALAGCQAKKWFYEATETVARSRHLAGKGVTQTAVADWGAVLAEKNKFTAYVPDSTIEGLYEAGIDYLEGMAEFTAPDTLSVGGETVQADFFVLATGARPMPLPIPGSEHLVTSDAFLDLRQLPEKIVFIGGGFISFEFAHFAARLGGKPGEIHILEVADRPLGPFDAEMVDLLVNAGRQEGIEVHTGVRIRTVEKAGTGFVVSLDGAAPFETDLVVHGAGRVPAINNLGLDAAGIDHSPRGIGVDHHMRTSNPAVFAVGDCAATVQLARVADYEAWVAARAILSERGGGKTAAIDYTCVPATLFTYPQYAMVGRTEAELEEKGISYKKSFAKGIRWPTYRRLGLTSAAYKILADDKGKILGAHMISDNATGIINTIRQAMLGNLTAAALHRQCVMTPYPSRESDLIYMLRPLMS